jgi:hypothetical protein
MAGVKIEGDWSCVVEVETGEIVYVAWPVKPTPIDEVMALRECYRWVREAAKPKGTYAVQWQYAERKHITQDRKTDASSNPDPTGH